MAKETITDFKGKVLGFVETNSRGDKTITDFYGKILGYYKKKPNITTDFYGRIISRGDTSTSLIWASLGRKK